MNIKELGEFKDPVLLFGGPYSNLQALEALIQTADSLGIAAGNTICTGDVVAYCGDPDETVNLVRQFGCEVVAGNCEKQLAYGGEDCGCGFDDASHCSMLSRGWYAYSNSQVSGKNKKWMGKCPDIVVFTKNGRRYAVIHGGVADISRFIWQVSDDEVFNEEIEVLEKLVGPVDVVVAGHSGIPFERNIGAHKWINVGAIGMPANDGSDDTWFAILEGEVRFARLKYDVSSARKKMEKVGLSQGYHETLETGYWPSEDTLPISMRRN